MSEIIGRSEYVTPETAKKWLGQMRKNRPLSDAKVLEYALAMEAGQWSVNGETIKFDKTGELFDGQHRLQACILAGKGFTSLVVRNVNDEHAFATVDVGKNRSHGDVFGIAGFTNPSLVASVALIAYLHTNGKVSWNGPIGMSRGTTKQLSPAISSKIKRMPNRPGEIPKEELLAFAEPLSEGLVSAARFAERWKQPRLLPRPLVGGGYYIFRDKSFNDAEQFFTDLDQGAGLTRTDSVYHLRERLISNSQSDAKLSRWMIFGLMLKAWNKRRGATETRSLRVQDGEEFPRKLV